MNEIFEAGKRLSGADAAFVLDRYIRHPDQIQCVVAKDADGRILGFQSLKHSVSGNPYGSPVGWGVIGTHIRPSAARRGIGRRFFASTLQAARQNALPAIDATIGTANAEGLAYYEAMGFRTYRQLDGACAKVYWLEKQ